MDLTYTIRYATVADLDALIQLHAELDYAFKGQEWSQDYQAALQQHGLNLMQKGTIIIACLNQLRLTPYISQDLIKADLTEKSVKQTELSQNAPCKRYGLERLVCPAQTHQQAESARPQIEPTEQLWQPEQPEQSGQPGPLQSQIDLKLSTFVLTPAQAQTQPQPKMPAKLPDLTGANSLTSNSLPDCGQHAMTASPYQMSNDFNLSSQLAPVMPNTWGTTISCTGPTMANFGSATAAGLNHSAIAHSTALSLKSEPEPVEPLPAEPAMQQEYALPLTDQQWPAIARNIKLPPHTPRAIWQAPVILGAAYVFPVSSNFGFRHLYLSKLYTRPAMRQLGIAKHLIDFAYQKANQENYVALSLDTSPSLSHVQAMYRRMGFIAATSPRTLNLAPQQIYFLKLTLH